LRPFGAPVGRGNSFGRMEISQLGRDGLPPNLALDLLRRKRPEQRLLAEPTREPPTDHLVEQEIREKIQQAFRRLPAKLQVTATLALLEEQPYEEIADALGISVGAVKLRVFRAVRVLRKQLNHLGVRH
jgi:RNA polymerase sigma factor (sigma-70 family)